MRFTPYNTYFPDHHWLYHIILSIFVKFGGDTGAKLSVCAFFLLLLLTVWRILHIENIRRPEAWLLLLTIISASFLLRISEVRVIALSLIFLLLAIYFIVQNKSFALLIISIIYTWTYTAYTFLPIIGVLWIISSRPFFTKEKCRLFYCILAGIITGAIINPYFPYHILFSIRFIWRRLHFGDLPMGGEWYPLNILNLVTQNFLLLLMVAWVIYILYKYQPLLRTNTIYYFYLFIFFTVGMIKSSRFVEYSVPFSILFLGCFFRDFAQQRQTEILARIKPPISYLIAIGIVIISYSQMMIWENNVSKNSFDYKRYLYASQWLKENTEEMETIYNVSWSDFPQLFYWNTYNSYICGLDPNFIVEYDSKIAQVYFDIMRCRITQPGYYIYKYFSSSYAIVSKSPKLTNFSQFIHVADNDKTMKRIYEDDNSIIYKITLID